MSGEAKLGAGEKILKHLVEPINNSELQESQDVKSEDQSALAKVAIAAAVIALPLIKIKDAEAAVVYCAADNFVGQYVVDPGECVDCAPIIPTDCRLDPPPPPPPPPPSDSDGDGGGDGPCDPSNGCWPNGMPYGSGSNSAYWY